MITPPNYYGPFFWVYTLAQGVGLPALLLRMFIILSLTPSLLPTSRNKNSTHSREGGGGVPQLSAVTIGKAKLGEVPSVPWLPTLALQFAPWGLGSLCQGPGRALFHPQAEFSGT